MSSISRRQFSAGMLMATGSPLFALSPLGGPVRPTIPASARLLRQSVAQVYADLKTNNPNPARLNLLAGQLSMLPATMTDDGTLAKAQSQWHPQTLVWTAQDTETLVANAAAAGVAVDASAFNGLDQRIQNQRDSFPLQVEDVFTSISGSLLRVAAKVQASPQHTAYRPASLHLRQGMRLQACPTNNFALMVAALAGALAAAGLTYYAAMFAAISSFERLLDAFTYCDTQLG